MFTKMKTDLLSEHQSGNKKHDRQYAYHEVGNKKYISVSMFSFSLYYRSSINS